MKNTSLPSIKTAVLVKDLISALEKLRDDEVKAAKVAMSAYKAKREEYMKAVKAHLRERASMLTADFEPPKARWGRRDIADWITDGMPSQPEYPNDEKCVRAKYDGLIAQLRLSSEPKVRLSPEDFRRFMAGDASACPC